MSALLRIVPAVADHDGGAAQAQNTLAMFRRQAPRDPKLLSSVPLPCEDCEHVECRKQPLTKEWRTLVAAGADPDVIALAEAAMLVEMEVCQKRVKLALVPASDIELDARGYCALDNWDHAYDAARERR